MSLRGHRVAVSTAMQSTRYLVVGYGPVVLAISADLVRGILTPVEAGFQTALTVAGETYHAAEIRTRLGLREAADSVPEARTVLCSNGSCHRAVHVDQVLGLTEVEPVQVMALPPHFREAEREWFSGLFLYGDGVALIFDPGWVLNERESPALRNMIADSHMVSAREAATETDMGRSHPAALVVPWLPVEIEEANDAEDTPWAQI